MLAYWSKLFPASYHHLLTDDPHKATHVLIVNAPHPADVPWVTALFPPSRPDRRILAHMEPEINGKYRHLWPAEEYRCPDPAQWRAVWTHATHLNVCEWHLCRTYDDLMSGDSPSAHVTNRDNSVALVLTAKYTDPGHIARIDVARALLAHGLARTVHGSCAKWMHGAAAAPGTAAGGGAFVPDKGQVLAQYKYTFNAENHSIDNYVTEKFWDAVLSHTFLFYMGHPCILRIVPQQFHSCFMLLPFDVPPTAAVAAISAAIRDGAYERAAATFPAFSRWVLENVSLASSLIKVLGWQECVQTKKCTTR
jgi:hypothetical protein